MLAERTSWLVKSNDKGGEHCNKDRLVRHALLGASNPWNGVIDITNLGDSKSTSKTRLERRIDWEKKSRKKGGSDDGNDECKMMCRLCAIINVPDPCISVINILSLCARDESEVGWKANEIHDGVKINHGNALHIPIGIRSSCKSIGVSNCYSLLRRGRKRLRRRKGKI